METSFRALAPTLETARKLLFGLLISLASLLGLSLLAASPAAGVDFEGIRDGYFLEEVTNNPDVVADLFAQDGGDARQYGLSRPTQITFLDNGDAFVAEKSGRVRAIVDGELQRQTVLDISSRVNTYIDRGMNGIAVKDGWLYVAYTHESGVTETSGTKTARISKFPLVKNGSVYTADPAAEVRLVGRLDSTVQFPSCTDRPSTVDCISTDAGSHSVGNLNFGPDGYLYAAVGDGAGFDTTEINAFDAQDIDNLSGKILRLTTDGQAPAGNPFFTDGRSADDNASKVWTYGLRNPTFFNFQPGSDRVLVGNVGWYNTEAAYNMAPGDNAGWPCYENGLLSNNGYERMLGCPLQTPVLTPFISYSHEERVFGGETNLVGAVTGVAVPTADEYADDIRGTVVYPDYVLGFVNAARLNDDGSPAAATSLIEAGAEGAVGVTTDSDGYLYFMIHDQGRVDGLPLGTLYRLRYNNDPNNPVQPLPSFKALASEDGSLSKRFDASSSFDPAGRAATYRWVFGDGNVADGEVVNHTYAEAGSYNVELTMTADGVSATVSQQVVVFAPPEEVAYPVVTTPNIFGDRDPRPDGVYEFVPSTEIPLEFSILNQGSDVTFFTVVNIRPAGSDEQVFRVEEYDQNLATGATKSYSFDWSTATPGEYDVDIEFYDQATFDDLEGRYPAAATFVVTTRAGDPVDPDDPMDPVVDPPANPNCRDEGDGNAWGYDIVAEVGCWIGGEVDLDACILGGNGIYYCPDGEAYDADQGEDPADPDPVDPEDPADPVDPVDPDPEDPMDPVVDPPANPNCVDEDGGTGDAWGVDPTTNAGCWIGGEVDLNVCSLGGNGLYYCPDGEAYDPNDALDEDEGDDDPMDPVVDPPANPNCVDEDGGTGDAWGVDPTTNAGCWIGGEVDLDICSLGGNGLYYCPDGEAYSR